jgi:D-alanyl-D-alanine carboxypeptidase
MMSIHTPNTRRAFLAGLAGAAAGCALPAAASYQLPEQAGQAFNRIATEFMDRHGVRGMAIAISRYGNLAYAKGFGAADGRGAAVTEQSRFRIASLSKPITATALFKLASQRRIALDARVFGEGGILGEYRQFADPRVGQITVRQLLTHTGGGWTNDGNDPMYRNPQMGAAQLIADTLARTPLTHAPGTRYLYSNFGYCVLGRVIERVSQAGYASHVTSAVLGPAGAGSMAIARNGRNGRQPREVDYIAVGADPYAFNVARMDAHGGWIASARELVSFLLATDGFPPGDVLPPYSIDAMAKPVAASGGYAHGWQVNAQGHRWHAGYLPGSASIMVRTSFGLNWAVLTNSTGAEGGNIIGPLDRLPWDMVKAAGWV